MREVDCLLVISGKYSFAYRLIEDTVFVYRIAHGASDYLKLFKEINRQE